MHVSVCDASKFGSIEPTDRLYYGWHEEELLLLPVHFYFIKYKYLPLLPYLSLYLRDYLALSVAFYYYFANRSERLHMLLLVLLVLLSPISCLGGCGAAKYTTIHR